MVYKCAALNCRSGYDGENKDPNTTFHAFPFQNQKLLQVWLKRLARKDFAPTKYSKLCSLHFTSNDFIVESNDLNHRCKRKRESTKLARRRLKDNAAPSVFSDLPSYYTSRSEPRRSGLSASSSRHENEALRLEERVQTFLNANRVENIEELIGKLSEELYCQKYLLHRRDGGAFFIHLSDETPPLPLATIFVNENLEVAIYQDLVPLPASTYKHILPTNKVTLSSQVVNLMAFARNKIQNKSNEDDQFKSKILNLILDFLLVTENQQQVSFLKLEQINLLFTSKHQRRYSAELLMMAYIIFSTSPRAFERLLEEQVVLLPSTKTLKKITMNLNSKTGLDDEQYLRLRFSQLNAFDGNVLLMIDEICLSKRVEASGGKYWD